MSKYEPGVRYEWGVTGEIRDHVPPLDNGTRVTVWHRDGEIHSDYVGSGYAAAWSIDEDCYEGDIMWFKVED